MLRGCNPLHCDWFSAKARWEIYCYHLPLERLIKLQSINFVVTCWNNSGSWRGSFKNNLNISTFHSKTHTLTYVNRQGGHKQATMKFYFTLLNLDMFSWNSPFGGFAYIWQSVAHGWILKSPYRLYKGNQVLTARFFKFALKSFISIFTHCIITFHLV